MGEIGVHAYLEPVIGLGIDIHTACISVEVSVLQDTVLLIVSHGYEITDLLVSSAYGKHMLGTDGRIVADLVHPVLIPGGRGILPYLPGNRIHKRLPCIVLVRIIIFRILQSSYCLPEVGRSVSRSPLEIHSGPILGTVAQSLIRQFHEIVHADEVIAFQSP